MLRVLTFAFALLAVALLPAAQAQQQHAVINVRTERAVPDARLAPGGSETLGVNVAVTFPVFSYCMDEMRMDLSVVELPSYASATIDPSSQPIRFNQPPPSQVHATTAMVRFDVRVTTAADAPALENGLYTLRADLAESDPIRCNIRPSHGQQQFWITNDYRPATDVRPIGWHPVHDEYYEMEVVNKANGATRVNAEAVDYDPMALGKLEWDELVLEPGKAGMFRVRFTDITPGHHRAVIGLRSSHAGPAEASTDWDELTIETDGPAAAPGGPDGGTAPAATPLSLLVVGFALALARRHRTGRA